MWTCPQQSASNKNMLQLSVVTNDKSPILRSDGAINFSSSLGEISFLPLRIGLLLPLSIKNPNPKHSRKDDHKSIETATSRSSLVISSSPFKQIDLDVASFMLSNISRLNCESFSLVLFI